MTQDLRLSIIVPVYNRPDEVKELLESLAQQTDRDFEVLIVEDGSKIKCEDVCKQYDEILNLHYYYKDNSGPGLSRNYGIQRASGNYVLIFDSDCLIPAHYIETVKKELGAEYVDAYGGPDAAHENFTDIQKAISYSMTSFFTTGGIRGGNEKAGKFHPRSFNMGFSKEVFEKTGGYAPIRFGEDIDLTLRILEAGFRTRLIKSAFVWHKRRTDFKKFFKQVFNSGCARINLNKLHPGSLKLVHCLPAAFLYGNIVLILLSIILGICFASIEVSLICIAPLLLYILLLFIDSLRQNSLKVAFLSIIAAYVQLSAYGMGFTLGIWKVWIKGDNEAKAFVKNFYK